MTQNLYSSINNCLISTIETCNPGTITNYHGIMSSKINGFDYQINITKISKQLNIETKDYAEKIANILNNYSHMFKKIEVSGNGFINIRLENSFILKFSEIVFQQLQTNKPQKIIIDFGGPNIAKELHVGHLRSLVIGECLQRLLKFRGHNVISDIHLGDWGLPMGMIINELIERRPDLFIMSYPDDDIIKSLSEKISQVFDLEKLYPEIVALCKSNSEKMEKAQYTTHLLQKSEETEYGDDHFETIEMGQYKTIWNAIRLLSLNNIKKTISRLDARFDLMNGESSVASLMKEYTYIVEEHGRISDGATIIDVFFPSDKKPMPPLIFKKSNETYTYGATDLVTLCDRFISERPNEIIYVVDKRQLLHFEQVFRAGRMLYEKTAIDDLLQEIKLTHVGFGTVNDKLGKPFKTRDGGIPTLNWMLNTAIEKAKQRTTDENDANIIGIGAIKYADLITNRESGYVFDIDRIMAMDGKTGPYIQYAMVRIQHILDKVDTTPKTLGKIIITCEAERDLLLSCAEFPAILELIEKFLEPHHLADYAYTLATKFSSFYESCPVIDDGGYNLSRVEILINTQTILKKCLYILGIGIPTKM